MGSSQKVAQSLFGCARANRSLGQPAAAMEHIAAARALCRTIDWPRGIAGCNREEGMARLDLGDDDAARDLLQAALDGFLALGEPGFVAATQAELACAYLALREPATARSLAEQAATAVGADRYGIDQPQTILFTLYRSLAALGDRAGAQEVLATAVAEIEEQAHRSRDPALRDSFRRTVPINREIVAALDDSRGRK
jgi:tetratricopeptide (TPR) repeat protein